MHPIKLHIFDFDGTLFKSPEKPDWWDKGWWGNLNSLSTPCVPETPTPDWWNDSVVQEAKRSLANTDIRTVLMTGRIPKFSLRVKSLLKQVGLEFPEVYFSTGGPTETFKVNTIKKILDEMPSIRGVSIWEDRETHLRVFSDWVESRGIACTPHLITVADHKSICQSGEPLGEKQARDIAPINPAWVKGVRLWVKKVFAPKAQYESLEDLIAHLKRLKDYDLERFWSYLVLNKGLLPRGEEADTIIQRLRLKVRDEMKSARDLLDDDLGKIQYSLDAMTPGTRVYDMDGGTTLSFYQRRDPADPFRAAVLGYEELVKETLGKVEDVLSGKVLRAISAFLAKYAEGLDFESQEILLEYNIGRMKLVYEGKPAPNYTVDNPEPADPTELSDYIPYFQEAKALLDRKGFRDLWYGATLIGCPTCGGENPLGKHFGVGAHYVIQKDRVVVFMKPRRFMVELLIHELGHRYYFKFMDQGDRARFASYFKEVSAVSDYGSSNPEEDFAEVFSHFVLGRDMTRDQLERFKAFLAKKDRSRFAATEPSPIRVAARYKSKKKDEDGNVHYEYSDRQVANRHNEKAERVENLRKDMGDLRKKIRTDLSSKDSKVRLPALAAALIDETCERVGNDTSAKDGHFGVTGWRKKHLSFSKGEAVFKYVGKSGVDHEKRVTTAPVVRILRELAKDKSGDDCLFSDGEFTLKSKDVNDYLSEFDITAKDIRGFRANQEMCRALKEQRRRGPKLPKARKERDKILKEEFAEALEEVADIVGHEKATLRSDYLVPKMEDTYMKDGTVLSVFKEATKSEAERDDESAAALIKPSPKKKPPRQDLRKHRIDSGDSDLDTKDDDMSLNYKKVGSIILRFIAQGL